MPGYASKKTAANDKLIIGEEHMKVTIQLEEKFEVLDAIHAEEAWLALREIQRLLRVNEKHDVGDAVTLQRISTEIIDVFSSRGDS